MLDASLGSPLPDERLYQVLRNQAYRCLARREHSTWELQRKMESAKHITQEVAPAAQLAITQILAELTEQDALSDVRFAEQCGRWYYLTSRGPLKLHYELTKHEIAESLIKQVMAGYNEKWSPLAAKVRRKKFGEAAPTNYKEWAKQAKFLQQRGFGEDQIEPYVD